MTIDTRHPQPEGASEDPAVVRDALAWSQKRQIDMLQIYGATTEEIAEWSQETWRLTEKLLLKIERRNR